MTYLSKPWKPIIGITMGDPCGIGPEIALKALINPSMNSLCSPFIIGNANVMKQAARIIGDQTYSGVEVRVLKDLRDISRSEKGIPVLDVVDFDTSRLVYGKIVPEAGKAAGDAIAYAARLAVEKSIDAIVTAPIHKKSLNLGGYPYLGHTEMLATITGASSYTMMLSYDRLRVIHVSTHVSLKEACDLVTEKRVYEKIILGSNICDLLGIEKPSIAVAGLNPHASDEGLLGDEEEQQILPAIVKARARGINVVGPFPSDTLFSKAAGGAYDLVIAMYHDQGHIPAKLLGFRWSEQVQGWGKIHGVNTTFGLPIIRTSVDHGVAFGKAGQGIADETSMGEAIAMASNLANRKRGNI